MNSAHARRLLVAAALLGLVLRAGFGLIYWQDRPLTHDEREYLALAANVAAGRGFAQDLPNEPLESDDGIGVQRFGRAPFYPLFLAPIVAFDASLREGRMPNDVPDAVKLAQSIVGAIGVLLIGAIGRRIGGDRMGAIAAFIAAIYPPLVWICAYALSEALFATLALACVWWLMPLIDGPSPEGGRGPALPRRHPYRLGRPHPARDVVLFALRAALSVSSRPRHIRRNDARRNARRRPAVDRP